MLAIAMVLDGSTRKTAAQTCGVTRQALRDWAHRYNKGGVETLAHRRGAGRPPRLTPERKAGLSNQVDDGPDPERDGVVRWRCADLIPTALNFDRCMSPRCNRVRGHVSPCLSVNNQGGWY